MKHCMQYGTQYHVKHQVAPCVHPIFCCMWYRTQQTQKYNLLPLLQQLHRVSTTCNITCNIMRQLLTFGQSISSCVFYYSWFSHAVSSFGIIGESKCTRLLYRPVSILKYALKPMASSTSNSLYIPFNTSLSCLLMIHSFTQTPRFLRFWHSVFSVSFYVFDTLFSLWVTKQWLPLLFVSALLSPCLFWSLTWQLSVSWGMLREMLHQKLHKMLHVMLHCVSIP